MLTFFKDNSDNIIKLFVNQIAMTIFGLLLSAASFSNVTLKLVTGLLSVLFYFYLIYTSAWDIGARDKIKIDGGRMTKRKYKGLCLGICANIPNLILILVSVICFYLASLFLLQWAANTSAVCALIAWFLNGMYIALISFANIEGVNFEILKLFLLLISVLFAVIVTHIGYGAGTKNIKIFNITSKSKHK